MSLDKTLVPIRRFNYTKALLKFEYKIKHSKPTYQYLVRLVGNRTGRAKLPKAVRNTTRNVHERAAPTIEDGMRDYLDTK